MRRSSLISACRLQSSGNLFFCCCNYEPKNLSSHFVCVQLLLISFQAFSALSVVCVFLWLPPYVLACRLIPGAEYDGHLAPTKGMAAAYLDPNLNHALCSGVKPRLSAGMERPPGMLERVLKVFHYFESSSEPCTWASNIRHGDATDIRVSMCDPTEKFKMMC